MPLLTFRFVLNSLFSCLISSIYNVYMPQWGCSSIFVMYINNDLVSNHKNNNYTYTMTLNLCIRFYVDTMNLVFCSLWSFWHLYHMVSQCSMIRLFILMKSLIPITNFHEFILFFSAEIPVEGCYCVVHWWWSQSLSKCRNHKR